LLCLMYAITYIDRVNVSTAAAEFRKEMNLSNTQIGLVFSAFAYPYLIFQIIGGWVGDRFGARRGLPVSRAYRREQLSWAGGVAHERRQQLSRHLRRKVRLPLAAQGDDRASGVHERAQYVEWEYRSALRVEDEDGGPFVHSQVAREARFAHLDLRTLEHRGDVRQRPNRRVEQQVSHRLVLPEAARRAAVTSLDSALATSLRGHELFTRWSPCCASA